MKKQGTKEGIQYVSLQLRREKRKILTSVFIFIQKTLKEYTIKMVTGKK